MRNNYYGWKAGEKVSKFPWVIRYYKSITDEKQYEMARTNERRIVLLISVLTMALGFVLGYIVFSP